MKFSNIFEIFSKIEIKREKNEEKSDCQSPRNLKKKNQNLKI